MIDPCVTRYGHSYERSAIFQHISSGGETCPMTRQPLRMRDIITNHKLRMDIRRWQKDNGENITVIMSDLDYSKRENILGFIRIDKLDENETERTEEDIDFYEHPQETQPVQERRQQGFLRRLFRVRS